MVGQVAHRSRPRGAGLVAQNYGAACGDDIRRKWQQMATVCPSPMLNPYPFSTAPPSPAGDHFLYMQWFITAHMPSQCRASTPGSDLVSIVKPMCSA